MCFQIMHIVSKFQFFIHFSIVVKLKNKIQNFKRGKKKEKKSLFLQLLNTDSILVVDHRDADCGIIAGTLSDRWIEHAVTSAVGSAREFVFEFIDQTELLLIDEQGTRRCRRFRSLVTHTSQI